MMVIMKKGLCLLALLALSALLGASIYDTVVFGPNLQAGAPRALNMGASSCRQRHRRISFAFYHPRLRASC
jgi:hypothetical protein